MKRKWQSGAPVHIYMKGIHGWMIFYRLEDLLVYTTILNVLSRKYGIKIISVCIMANHIHLLVYARDISVMYSFVIELNKTFAREYNKEYGRKGRLFEHFGWAQKPIGKKVRSCMTYINNNPVTGHIVETAIEYRWNFLAYNDNAFPFSKKYWKKNCRRAMRRSLDMVSSEFAKGHFLRYSLVNRLFATLTTDEKRKLSDYIVSCYNPLNYSELKMLYKDVPSALTAFALTAGEEYDLPDDWSDYSLYRKALVMMKRVFGGQVKYVENLDVESLNRAVAALLHIQGMTVGIIRKFLHLTSGDA